MTLNEAKSHAEVISKEYGHVVVFREPSAKESYQCMASSLPVGAQPVFWFKDGKQQ